jgi:hypothetical protein
MSFPSGADTLTTATNITSSDMDLIISYRDALANNNLTLANQILLSITNVNEKIINASRINEIINVIKNIDDFYNNEIDDYLNQNINRYTPLMNYNSATTYDIGNIVISPTAFGILNLYISLVDDNTNNSPSSSPTYWELLLDEQHPVQVPIQETQPTGLSVNDVWIKIIGTY